ncbi:VWA domain-containing protein [Aliiroseovarius subalbicans]|uniref:vWA domain-containing protein n=1 Tax=Aliiroseovarius subalbicans TaxID=2925840 RepID=UPI001F57A4E7|nr:VWA domain-containing protein [Aliiroseovarius subalbicans]MCI2400736.1 VWA domain-containing protein [Aliiroseovarius subalbicans]
MSDDDDLTRLSKGLKAAAPAPDDTAKADNIALAMKNFDDLQGSADGARLTSEASPKGAFVKGVAKMFNTLTSRGAMGATTAIVAVGFAVWVVMPNAPDTLSLPEVAPLEEVVAPPVAQPQEMEEADLAADAVAGLIASSPAPKAEMRTRVLAGEMAPTPIDDGYAQPLPDRESFANEAPNPLKVTGEEPVSTFSIDVDTASYAVVRNSLSNGSLPAPDAVRVEEMVNYFPYAYPDPDGAHPFQPTVTVMETPWNSGTQLVHIGIQGDLPEVEARPPLNLVFLIDSSGSMDAPNKLPLLKQSFRLMLGELRPEDQVSIVAYAGSTGQVLEPTSAGERTTIMAALDRLSAGGSTAGQAGLQQAYQVAEAMSEDGEVSRVILATDGDFNVGLSDPEALKDFIADKRETGTYLSVLGFGRGNLQDATMQALAQNGNGTAAYIDTLSEAQKVLVDQLTGALFPIADDVKIQVEFNPAMIAEYRLIGYETRSLAREDFNNDAVDAGEIGAGHNVTALYEITPVGSDAVMTDALRYAPSVEQQDNGELGYLKLRYKAPGEEVSILMETPILPGMGEVTSDAQFSAAIAGFGQLLRDGKYLGDWTYSDLIDLANAHKGDDPYGYRAEAVTLMRLAESLSQQ